MIIIECVYVHSPLPSLTGLPQRTWGHSAAPYHACQSIHVWLQVCYFNLPISGGCILDCFNWLKLRARISKWPKLTKDPMSSWSMVLSWFCLFFPQLDTSIWCAQLCLRVLGANNHHLWMDKPQPLEAMGLWHLWGLQLRLKRISQATAEFLLGDLAVAKTSKSNIFTSCTT